MTRDEVIENLNTLLEATDEEGDFLLYPDEKEAVKISIKTLKQERAGHWIGHIEHCEKLGVMPSGLGVYEWCSNCDCGIDVREWHRNPYNFCPNCGIKMEE